ncbi:Adenylyltransferase and sulfurtransferase MOCS3 [Taenia crassiceps]|uniref:Adenylyltransferase and sulfurtransferase MOCS3 homolog n=1 Tax=Taenia crassiceps TaxID=6207 RepID=A0ABR4QGF2_9CEST
MTLELCGLLKEDIYRYSRQIIIPEFGPSRQIKLARSHVLIVGCGGLGCPAAVYLAAGGVINITLVDDDVVEVSNLHRQVMHSEDKVGYPKVESLAQRLKSVNSTVRIVAKNVRLTSENACDIISGHDIVLDCTDNIATRYLLNDACAACGPIPLVSGSALRFEGQMTVYLTHRPPERDFSEFEAKRLRLIDEDKVPCFRCLNPSPPPAVQACSDAGVLGIVPGIIGTLQAAEVIKLLSGIGESMAGRLLVFDLERNSIRTVKLRQARPDCKTCSRINRITPQDVKRADYADFCDVSSQNMLRPPMIQKSETRMSVQELKEIRDSKKPHLLIDIRPAVETEICRLTDCLYIPFNELYKESNLTLIRDRIRAAHEVSPNTPFPVILLCRRGNKSHAACNQFAEALERILPRSASSGDLTSLSNGDAKPVIPIKVSVRDVAGGLQSWSEHIDNDFPVY